VIPTSARYQDEVQPFIGNLTTKHMKENLETFTSFRTRYYKSETGAKSSVWLLNQIEEVAKSGGGHVSVKPFKHSVKYYFYNSCLYMY
jgi:leucyl aminopeptidase